ncbi:MAG: NAD(P)/FAD-dependent oxidoreductase [Clostridia bacterium]|nr:NAD(P)/FAD-dependent oxidoreductase [Clostridia bacterium]
MNEYGKRVAVIGCGAAGMMAAVTAAESGASVTVYERNPFAGKKLRITGKGRCNVTNNCTPQEVMEAVSGNPKFLYGVLNRFTPADTMAWFENAGVPLKTERGRRVFPVSDKAADIQNAMVKRMRESGVNVKYNVRVSSVEECADGIRVNYENTSEIYDAVILATGGISYPTTGSTGDGHKMLAKLGVKITQLKPSLVPVVTEENLYDLSGLTLKNVRLTVTHDGNAVYTEQGEMLLTHFGVSGPLVLTASANMQKYPVDSYRMAIDFKPALSEEELDRRLLSDFAKYSARDFVNSLGDLLPVKLIPYVVRQCGIDPHKKTGEITREERRALLETLKGYPLTPKSFRPIDEAIITSGGVEIKEINPKTMELKNHPGIFVCGELIDVDAYTGGYNLQLAFSTAVAAGKSAGEW